VSVTVAIPVRNGGELFARTLRALADQTVAHELLICDSSSSDGSADLAREHGARVIEISPSQFSHGGTRNLLMREAAGSHVALLTQDAEPADENWLQRLLAGFELSSDVALVYGPYTPRPWASPGVRIELDEWFASLATADGAPRIDRLSADERALAATELLGQRGFFTDANACIARGAWERVPFREVAYAEDRALAMDMLRQGYAKVYLPEAAVLHSHSYTASEQLRRCFDEWRGLHDVYGWREPADPRRLLLQLRGHLGQARRAMRAEGMPARTRWMSLASIAEHHILRTTGAVLGSRSDRLPAGLRRRLSLERRAE
jgi:GT2 family glycosyltransferase